jgi:NAD(P)-dependent dehydrogenase (short-subunit alcohol dehydrogenase family)
MARMARLSGRRFVITGISRGVGLETARLFLAEGAEVIGVARDAARLERAQRELDPAGTRLSVLAADVSTEAAAVSVARAVAERWGALDVLFNNAGVQLDGATRGLTSASESVLAASLATNLWAPFRLCRALVPALERGHEPRIVNVSSGAGNFESMRMVDIPTYRLSKWALNGLTLLLAGELAGRISVNAFDPGWVKTDLGGVNAPGSPVESAQGALSIVTLPFATTGKFWKDGAEIPF